MKPLTATTTRLNNASVLNQPHKAYVTTGPFADAIYSYSVSTNFTGGQFVTTGTLTAQGAGVVGVYNKADTVLRENGKKLVPGVNPDITKYYVGVYHPVFGSGFIDPNGPLFALYNSDKPYNGSTSGDLLENDFGPPVITGGLMYTTSSVALTYAANIDVNPTPSGAAGTYQVLTLNLTGNTALTATSIPPAGRLLYFIITADGSNRTVDFNAGFLTSYPVNGTQTVQVTLPASGYAGTPTPTSTAVNVANLLGNPGTPTTVTANTVSTWTFISNGAKLIEVSRAISGTQ